MQLAQATMVARLLIPPIGLFRFFLGYVVIKVDPNANSSAQQRHVTRLSTTVIGSQARHVAVNVYVNLRLESPTSSPTGPWFSEAKQFTLRNNEMILQHLRAVSYLLLSFYIETCY